MKFLRAAVGLLAMTFVAILFVSPFVLFCIGGAALTSIIWESAPVLAIIFFIFMMTIAIAGLIAYVWTAGEQGWLDRWADTDWLGQERKLWKEPSL